jgi:hypothetical protein
MIEFFEWLSTFEAIRPIIWKIRDFFNVLMASYAVQTIGNLLMFFLFNNLYASVDIKID